VLDGIFLEAVVVVTKVDVIYKVGALHYLSRPVSQAVKAID
jgi:hypothetical protein